MFTLTKPAVERIQQFINQQRQLPFNYAEVGATRGELPSGYLVNHARIQLGQGEVVFKKAAEALRAWKMFDTDWAWICWPETPVEAGASVAVLACHFGFWSLHPARIIYLIDEQDERRRRIGFAYGTLMAHGMQGEETFIIEWHRDDDSVWYDLRSFSRPNQLLAKLGAPIARRLQKRFAQDSRQAMLRAVSDSLHSSGSD
jgi:uncharacterized protein (UPF0548 family)